MKKYLGLFIALTLILNLTIMVYGENSSTVSSTGNIDLEQAYKLLETNNLEIKLLDKKIEMKIAQNEDLLDAIDDTRGRYSTYDSTNLQYRKTEKLSWKQATLELDSLNNDRSEKLKSLKTNVKQQYLNLQLQKDNIEYVKQDIEVMDKRLKEVELRVKLGQAKDSDYKSAYSQSLSLKNQLNSLNTQYETSMLNFKRTLGVELNQPIQLQKLVLAYSADNKETLKSDFAKAIESEFSIQKLNKEIEMKKIEIELVKDYTDAKYSSEYRDLQIELSEMETQLAYQKLALEAELRTEQFNVMILQDNIKLQQVNLEIEKINYDSIMAKSKLGMVDIVTEMNAKISYDRQKTNLQQAINDYLIALEQFNDNMN